MQQFLFTAQDMNLTNGDFALFTYTIAVSSATKIPWSAYNMTGQDANYRRTAFYAVKEVPAISSVEYVINNCMVVTWIEYRQVK